MVREQVPLGFIILTPSKNQNFYYYEIDVVAFSFLVLIHYLYDISVHFQNVKVIFLYFQIYHRLEFYLPHAIKKPIV